MFDIVFEPQFERDYGRVVREHPQVHRELATVFEEFRTTGTVPPEYRPHVLDNPGGNYNGYHEFHLLDGRFDAIVISRPHRSNPSIRFVRLGTHAELFQGPTY